jgi:hypothetical protein
MNYFILTLLGYILSGLVDVSQRNKKSKRTPDKFSWKFFIKDNYERYLISGAISLCLIVIYQKASFDFEEQTYEDLFALAVGFSPDLIISWLKRKFGFLKS